MNGTTFQLSFFKLSLNRSRREAHINTTDCQITTRKEKHVLYIYIIIEKENNFFFLCVFACIFSSNFIVLLVRKGIFII